MIKKGKYMKIGRNEIIRKAHEICKNFNSGESNIKLKICTNPKILANFYNTYKGVKEFLYIAPKEEINQALKQGAVFFCVICDNKLAGVAKAAKLMLPYPFFCIPKEMDKQSDYWGLSGLYVHSDFQGRKFSTILLKAATTLAQMCHAAGIYADFDYRNIASMRLVSKYYNMLGYTDGRNGSPDESTLYTTFFKDFTNSSKNAGDLNIVFDLSMQDTKDAINQAMAHKGSFTINVVEYCGGYNEVVCFDSPYVFDTTKILIKQSYSKEENLSKTIDK